MPPSPLLSLRNLRLTTPQQQQILKGIDLTLHAGETVALVGESGSGKTATALSLTNLFPPSSSKRAIRLLYIPKPRLKGRG